MRQKGDLLMGGGPKDTLKALPASLTTMMEALMAPGPEIAEICPSAGNTGPRAMMDMMEPLMRAAMGWALANTPLEIHPGRTRDFLSFFPMFDGSRDAGQQSPVMLNMQKASLGSEAEGMAAAMLVEQRKPLAMMKAGTFPSTVAFATMTVQAAQGLL